MRDIKFRAWVVANTFHEAHMVHDFAVYNGHYSLSDEFNYLDDSGYLIEEDYPLMQYTGLKDKNGVEIYEGDIIKEYPDKQGFWIRVVEYNGHGFVLSKLASFLQHEVNWTNQLEVIGNIYKSPELLNNDK